MISVFTILFFLGVAAQENAAGVNIEVVKILPSLQEREQQRGRFGGRGRGGFGDRSGGNRFSGGRGGRGGGFSDRRNSSGGFKGRNNGNKW